MKLFTILLAICLCCVHSVFSASTLSCSTTASSSPVKYYCTVADNTSNTACAQCAAGVKYFCPTVPPKSTSSWIKGVKVLDNCNTIPKYTAIATFPNGGYSGHAAVFMSCSGTTINVYDQWDGKQWSARQIWDTNGAISNNPTMFYTVLI